MLKNPNLNIKEYITNSQKFEKVDWWNLPKNAKLRLLHHPNEIKKLGNFTTVRRLKLCKKKDEITKYIIGIKKYMTGNKDFKISFPINLKLKEYAQFYALMVSEGSYNTEFSLNVPEEFFHILFREDIRKLISNECSCLIKQDYNKGFLRSRAPAILRKIIPIPDHIPYIIINNKEFAREYLKVAFEAEGSPIFNKKQHKRYIKLSRYNNISPFVKDEILLLNKRIYLGSLKKEYPKLFEKIKNNPPKILEGEQILLKYHFGIESKLSLEAIRHNQTDFRAGKITARWILFIYANNIDKFIQQIGFISKEKIEKIEQMKNIKGHNPQYFALRIIGRITDKDNYFYRKEFIKEMKRLNYKSPSCYLWRYLKSELIRRMKKGYYKLLV
tara:strand:+ start:334 stop:1491 length:1158 start_codon:yes stop_codon:yes gene_type:complete